MSDHISGPRALADPIADITDVYAFPSPERPGHLVLVMNTLPFAQPSDSLLGRPHLPLPAAPAHRSTAATGPAPFAVGEREFVFDCVFSTRRRRRRRDASDQEGTCTTPAGDTVAVRVNDEHGGCGARRAGVRRTALGSVHHGRAGGVEDDRHGRAGVHGSQLDLPRRQERPQPRRRDRRRRCSTAPSWSVSSPRR